MARINLLPWREELRAERQRQFMTSLLLTAVLGVVLVFLIGMVFDQRISNQQSRNQSIRSEISRLESQIRRIEELEKTRADLLSRKQIIEQLQASRSLTVEMMDKLAKTIPVGVTLDSIAQQGMNVTLAGTSQSNARVSAYLQSLADNDLFVEPDLTFVRAMEGDSRNSEPYEFNIKVKLRTPASEDEAQGYDTIGAGEGI
jgi:type IV pilus assembly protein PilN